VEVRQPLVAFHSYLVKPLFLEEELLLFDWEPFLARRLYRQEVVAMTEVVENLVLILAERRRKADGSLEVVMKGVVGNLEAETLVETLVVEKLEVD